MQLKVKNSLFLASILCVAFGIRLIHSNQSFWLDEGAQAIESARALRDQFDIAGDFQPPLFHLIVFMFELVSKEEWFLRLASILPGIATIWGSYLITKKLYGDKVGRLTALLGMFSAYHYYYSQELRPYSLSTMFAVFSMYFFLQLLELKPKKIHPFYILTSTLALYSTYLAGFLLLTHLLITIVYYRSHLKSIIQHLTLIFLGFVPWLPYFWEQFQNGTQLTRDYVGWSTAVSLPLLKALPLTFIKFFIGMIRVDLTLTDITLTTLVGSAIGYTIWKGIKKPIDRVILMWAIVPILIAFTVSFFVPVLEPKRVLFCLPALWILLAKGLSVGVNTRVKQYVFLALYTLPLIVHVKDSSLLREDWRGSVVYIESKASVSSVVFFAFPGEFAPYKWYQNGMVDTIATKIFTIPNRAFLDQNMAEVLLYDQVFVYDYLMDLSDPKRLTHSWLKDNGFTEVAVTDFRGLGFLRIFVKTMPVAFHQ